MDKETTDFPLPSNGASITPAESPKPLNLGSRTISLGKEFYIDELIEGKDAAGNSIHVGAGIIAEYTNSKGNPVPEITTDKEETFEIKLTTYNASGKAVIAYLTLVVEES